MTTSPTFSSARCAGWCGYARSTWHDAMLGLEADAGLLGRFLVDAIEGAPGDGALWAKPQHPTEWDDLVAFIRSHAWRDQGQMEVLAQLVERFQREEAAA